jgi:hypothetical protein
MNLAEENILKSINTSVKISKSIQFKSKDAKKQIVYGEVYAPDVIDTHGHCMLAEDVEKMAHEFMSDSRNRFIDVMHNNVLIDAVAVESFIAKSTDKDFAEGAWVLGVKINDSKVWAAIEKGELNGYSMEVLSHLKTIKATIELATETFGFTEVNNDHTHAFYVKFSEDGKVIGGYTSEDNGHTHEIKYGTATEIAEDHAHRYFLA